MLPANRTNMDKTKATVAHAMGRIAVARMLTELVKDELRRTAMSSKRNEAE